MLFIFIHSKKSSDAVGDVWKFKKKVGKNEFLFLFIS